jgi:hypothetical protein
MLFGGSCAHIGLNYTVQRIRLLQNVRVLDVPIRVFYNFGHVWCNHIQNLTTNETWVIQDASRVPAPVHVRSCLCICLSVCLCVCLSVCLPVCLFVCARMRPREQACGRVGVRLTIKNTAAAKPT